MPPIWALPGSIKPFDLVFLDPPYGKGLGELALTGLRDNGWLAPGATIVFEESVDANSRNAHRLHPRRSPRIWRRRGAFPDV